MNEIQSQFVYKPNGVLDIRTHFRGVGAAHDHQLEVLERFSELLCTSVDDEGTVHVDIKGALGSEFSSTKHGTIRSFLSDVGILMPPFLGDETDRVVNAQYLGPQGFSGGLSALPALVEYPIVTQ